MSSKPVLKQTVQPGTYRSISFSGDGMDLMGPYSKPDRPSCPVSLCRTIVSIVLEALGSYAEQLRQLFYTDGLDANSPALGTIMTRIFSVTTILIGGIFSCAPLASTCAAEDYTITTDHIYGHKAGMALTFDVIRPTENANGIGLLYMVSRGWVSNYFDLDEAMAKSQKSNGRFYNLIDRGYTLFMVRHGSSPYFKVPDAVSDVRQALRHIRFHADEFNVDEDRLGVFGNSAGGHLALSTLR